MSARYTSAQVAAMTGLSRRRINQWALTKGKPKVGRDRIFDDAEVAAILATKHKPVSP